MCLKLGTSTMSWFTTGGDLVLAAVVLQAAVNEH